MQKMVDEDKLSKLLKLAEEIENFQFCSPDDDPVVQNDVFYQYKQLVKFFIHTARKVQDAGFQAVLDGINIDSVETFYDLYDISVDLALVINDLRELLEYPISWSKTYSADVFIEETVIRQYRKSHYGSLPAGRAFQRWISF